MLNSEACKTWYLVQLNLKYLRYEESKIATMAMSGAVGADLDLNPLDFASAISQQHSSGELLAITSAIRDSVAQRI
jgi:hypothetical protein